MPTDGQSSGTEFTSRNEDGLGSAHLVGVCGAGMKALAELLSGFGWSLSGSDLLPANPSVLELMRRGLRFSAGHSADNLPVATDCLIYSPAIRPENPERLEAMRREIPQWSYSEMVGRLMRSRRGLCISGTHGKSTTTAMVGWVMREAGWDPSVLVGAELCSDGQSGHAGKSDWFVVESCEFNQSFLDFCPAHAVILNIEPDHFDCYPDLPSVVKSFGDFAGRVPAPGFVLANGDCTAAMDAVATAKSHFIRFGIQSHCDWRAEQIEHSPQGTRFQVFHQLRPWGEISLRLHGEHNALNALAAAALCAELGVPANVVMSGLRSFGGLKRRFEVVAERGDITLIDDYAHHPTAVRATLQTARQVYGARRIWVAFQPHQVSRTTALMDDFAASFDDADEVLITPVFAARERVTDEPVNCARELARRIALRGKRARFVGSLDRIIPTVDDAHGPGDVLIAMGAGDIDRIHHEFT